MKRSNETRREYLRREWGWQAARAAFFPGGDAGFYLRFIYGGLALGWLLVLLVDWLRR